MVSAGSAMQAVALLEELELLLELEELLEEELLEELLEEDVPELPLLLDPPPQAARKAAAPPEASQPSICRRWRNQAILCKSPCSPGCSWATSLDSLPVLWIHWRRRSAGGVLLMGVSDPSGEGGGQCRCRASLKGTLKRECGSRLSRCVSHQGFVSGCVRWLTVRTNPPDTGVLFSMDE